jgi:hypothetical protein
MTGYDALRIAPGQMGHQKRAHHAEHARVDGDAQRQGEDRGGGESRRLEQLADGEAYIGQNAFNCGPLPCLAAVLLDQRNVSELAPRLLFGLGAGKALIGQFIGSFRQVLLDGDGEVFVATATRERISERHIRPPAGEMPRARA